MPLEKLVADTATTVTNLAKDAIKETWSKLDAASDKPKPGDYLSKNAIRSIQGITNQSPSLPQDT